MQTAVLRRYRCQICTRESEARQRIDSPLLTVCPLEDCRSAALLPKPSWEGTVTFPGGRAAAMYGETRFRREEVVRERDGSESVYRSVEQMRRAELDRAIHPKIAEDNVRRAAKRLLPHTDAAKYQESIEARVA